MSAGSGAAWLNCSGVWMFSGSDRWCLGGVCGVSGGCLGVSGWCLGSVWGLLVVSGGCWMVSGWCLRHFFQSGHFVPPPCHTGIQNPVPNRVNNQKNIMNLNQMMTQSLATFFSYNTLSDSREDILYHYSV